MSHYNVLRKIYPIRDMTGEIDNDLSIKGKYMDQVDATSNVLHQELFPNTSTLMLSSYERVFDTTAVGDTSRQNAIVAAERVMVNKDGRLNPAYYIALADSLGYDATIYESPNMFTVSATSPPATELPGILYDQEVLWTWYLDSTGSTAPNDRTNLMNIVTERSPAFSKVIYNFA